MRHRQPSSNRRVLLAERAHTMRFAMTESEARLFDAIRGRKLGVLFRRQVVLAGFIVDFVAPAAKLVVEVDGGYHEQRRRADACRDRILARLGYRVLRLEAELVLLDIETAIARIREALASSI